MKKAIEIGLIVHQAIEAERKSFDESEDTILIRLVGRKVIETGTITAPDSETSHHLTQHADAIPIGLRTTGQWSARVGDSLILARNLREAYISALSKIAELDTTIFAKLDAERAGRRRVVAKQPAALYPSSPHLADPKRNNWHKLGEWCVDLNLSRDQAGKRIRRASALAGLHYGRDVVIKDGLQAL